MNFLAVLEAKRDGRALSTVQIQDFVAACTAGTIPDYQVAAFLMAVYFRGLNSTEARALTLAMRDSGDRLVFPSDSRPLVDKHSTGGVGDKVSLPLAPLLACLGFRVPMISGRGLGITGGTLDKLESIPGFATALEPERIVEIVQNTGCVICGQTARMAPADRVLYALRDVTATVPSIPLIVASILSKKLAESLDALVLDVKYGAAAFMSTPAQGRELAQAMVSLGNECGVSTSAMLTNMNTPLGRAAGNWLEVRETVDCLECGKNVAAPAEDLRELVLACAAQLLVQTGKSASLEDGRRQAESCLASGRPREKWDEMLAAQGVDLGACARKLACDHAAPVVKELRAATSGFVSRCDASRIGNVIRALGGGRLTKESVVQAGVGVDRMAKPGDAVERGGVLARVHAMNSTEAEAACAQLESAFRISPEPSVLEPLILEMIG